MEARELTRRERDIWYRRALSGIAFRAAKRPFDIAASVVSGPIFPRAF